MSAAAESVVMLHVEHAAGGVRHVRCEDIAPNPCQPRQNFDTEQLDSLAESIKRHGLLQPVIVRAAGAGYVLVAGERRLRAAQTAGLEEIPVLIRDEQGEDDRVLAFVENMERADLNPVEEGEAYVRMLSEMHVTQQELASLLGVSRDRISQAVLIPRLPEPVRRRVAAGVLSFGHARALCGLKDPGQQEWLAERIVAEGLSVRSTEERILLGDVPGYEGEALPRRRRNRQPPTLLRDVAESLSDRLSTRVTVQAAVGKGRGRIVIDFADDVDLSRILEAMRAPDES